MRKNFFRAIINYPQKFPSWPDFEISSEAFWTALAEISPFTIPEGYRTFYRLYASRFSKTRWGDKTPLYCMSLVTIRRILPEARFIHIIRDGRDAALSLRKMWFSPGWDMATQAAYWRKCILAARRKGLGHPDYMEVRYEKLILNTRETLKQICKFLDLDYDDSMMRYYMRTPQRLKEHKGRLLPDGTLLTEEQRYRQQQGTTEPLDQTRVFAWKSAIQPQEREQFEHVAGDLLKKLGYEV
ncbi:MAG: hypothetical protein A2Z19_03080 [Deltaproteobacteria bacterium RBG_16_54_18]|nr:MAG: hypothetical protein A2Z19_03080 [Deltaproteobacteria bacterium RBG_16_54_18]